MNKKTLYRVYFGLKNHSYDCPCFTYFRRRIKQSTLLFLNPQKFDKFYKIEKICSIHNNQNKIWFFPVKKTPTLAHLISLRK